MAYERKDLARLVKKNPRLSVSAGSAQKRKRTAKAEPKALSGATVSISTDDKPVTGFVGGKKARKEHGVSGAERDKQVNR